MAVPQITLELAVGDVLVIGNRTLTVIDIEGSEVHFRIDDDLSALPLELTTDELRSTAGQPQNLRPKAK